MYMDSHKTPTTVFPVPNYTVTLSASNINITIHQEGMSLFPMPRHACRDKVWMEIAFFKLSQSAIDGNKKLIPWLSLSIM